MQLHPAGRIGVGKNQGVLTTEFPLLQPSFDIEYLLADACLVINPHTAAGRAAAIGGLYIRALSGFGTIPPDFNTPGWALNTLPPDKHHCIINNRDDAAVLNTLDAQPAVTTSLQGRLMRVVWDLDYTYTLVLTYHTHWPSDGTLKPREYASILVPERAIFCDSIVQFAPVTRLFADRPKTPSGPSESRAFVRRLADGFNTTVLQPPATQFSTHSSDASVLWSVDAGSGLGKSPNCSPPLQTINGLPPTNTGEFVLSSDACTAVHTAADSLVFSNDCRACCDCDDYAQAGVALDAADSRYKQLGVLVEAFREEFVPVVEQWNAAVQCANSKVLSLQFSARLCPSLLVALNYCNVTDECAKDIVLGLDLTGGNPVVVDVRRKNFPQKEVTAVATGSKVIVRFKDVLPKGKETIFLTLTFPGLTAAVRPVITGILQAAVNGTPLLFDGRVVQATAETTLRCPVDDNDFADV